MDFFAKEFKEVLVKTVGELESDSQIEVVVVIKAISGNYEDFAFKYSLMVSLIAFTLFMFLPTEFGTYLIYTGTIFAFIIPFLFFGFFPPALRKLIPEKIRKRNVEIMGRALFQKAGIWQTQERIGVLIYGSIFEKEIRIVADRGAENSLPLAEWSRINESLQKTLINKYSGNLFLAALENCSEIFARYLPIKENDFNELPDNLEIEL